MKNDLIRYAMTALQTAQIVQNNRAEKAYNGAIASFGASLTQSGLLATLAIYSHDSGEASRPKILKALSEVLNAQQYAVGNNLFTHALTLDQNQLLLLEKRISTAAVALKLALRTFKLD